MSNGCIFFDLDPKDRFISVEIEDATGRPVNGMAFDENDQLLAAFCGKTDRPFRSGPRLGAIERSWLPPG